MDLPAPIVESYDGIHVVRDDRLPGGTKLRYLIGRFAASDELVYATPAYGGAQLALAYAARMLGKRATIFVAKRAAPHARTREAQAAGARVFQVPTGYLSNVQAKARRYCDDTGAELVAFGGAGAATTQIIAAAMRTVWESYGPFDEVWSAAGSGVLTCGLQAGVPSLATRIYAVAVGRALHDAGRATIIRYPAPFDAECRAQAPFPSCPNYDLKAWQICRARSGAKHGARVLFWNVLGPSPTPHRPLSPL